MTSAGIAIQISRGLAVLVSPEDADRVRAYKWHAVRTRRGVYAARSTGPRGDRRLLYLHKFICESEADVDHANGDTLDCRRGNLRPASEKQNAWNRKPEGRRRYKGISRNGSAWAAEITENGRRHYLGRFPTPEAAAAAYDEAAVRYFGQFAWLNFPRHAEGAQAQ